MVQKKRIVFFFPSKTLGGAQTLFIRLIKRLHADGFKLGYVDFSSGTMRKSLAQYTDIQFIDFELMGSNGLHLEPQSIVITGFNFINLVSLYFQPNVQFLFWFLSPYNLPIRNLSRKLKVKLEEIALIKRSYKGFYNYTTALDAECVYFMDGLCFELNGEPNTKYDPYLPLYLDLPKSEKTYDVSSTRLNLSWVGRIDLSMKYHCVVYLIQQFEFIKKNPKYKDVTLIIIGDGAGGEKIRNLCSSSHYNKDIKLIKSIPYNDLHSYMLKNIDVVFAHGTTCLESASLAIPTVCLDAGIYEFKSGYKFKWLFTRDKYDVGKTEFNAEFSGRGITLAETIEQVIKQRSLMSELSYDVVSSQYDQNLVLEKFQKAIVRVEASNLCLRVNFITLFVDSLVHWQLAKKVFRVSLVRYIKILLRR